MKKYITGFIITVFAVIAVLPLHSMAADESGSAKAVDRNKIELKQDDVDKESVSVEFSRPSVNGAELNALRMSFRILTNEADSEVVFRFGENGSGTEEKPDYIAAYRYHQDEENEKEGILNIYAASAGELFKTGDANGDSRWEIGQICVKNSDGVTVRASLLSESVEAASGDRAQQLGSNTTEIVYPDGGKSVTVKVGNGGKEALPDEGSTGGGTGGSGSGDDPSSGSGSGSGNGSGSGSGSGLGGDTGSGKTLDQPETQADSARDLKSLLDEVKAYRSKDYSVSSYKALQDAIRQAEQVLAREDATPAEVEAALMALQNAKAGLEPGDSSVSGNHADSGSGTASDTGSDAGSSRNSEDNVQTGDSMDVYVYMITALLSLLIASAAYRLRRKYE